MSLSAASCAHLCVSGGLSRNDLADLLWMHLDSSYNVFNWPERKSRSQRVMHCRKLVPLCPSRGWSGFGQSISCSKIKGRIHSDSMLYSSVPMRSLLLGCFALSTQTFKTSSKQSVTSSSSSCLIFNISDCRKLGSSKSMSRSHSRPSSQ